MTEVIGRGISLGKKLGKKLEIRNEERSTKWTRQNSGRIDKRLIAELGFDNENIFKTTFIEKYNDAYMHISIDGSGSMSGINFDNALKSTVAICQAASMAGNIHVQVSLRVTSDTNRVTKPLIVFLYDSKINGIIHIKKFWKYLGVSGTTPEGLCFEAIMDQIIKDAAGRDAFFLNYSDGQPVFHSKDFSYVGTTAYNHTRKEVDKLRAAGIKVMSFFISDDRWNSYSADITPFKTMYGKDAVKIDPTALVPLAKEINKKFLQK
jgi:nitric oxide reductase activation protein